MPRDMGTFQSFMINQARFNVTTKNTKYVVGSTSGLSDDRTQVRRPIEKPSNSREQRKRNETSQEFAKGLAAPTGP